MYVHVFGTIDTFVLGTMKVVFQDQYKLSVHNYTYGVNQVIYVCVVPEVMTQSRSSTLMVTSNQ